MPPPPPGAQPPPLWGTSSTYVRCSGDRVTDVRVGRRSIRVAAFAQPEDFRDYFKTKYGPVMAAYRLHAEDAERTAALDRDVAELARQVDQGGFTDWEYLLFTARRRG